MLEKLGYAANLVSNGKEALDAFAQKKFDIILMDQHMPVMDGKEAAIAIRKMEQGTHGRVAIISFTANVLQEDQKERMAKYMDDFILKPITIEALEKALSVWEERNIKAVHAES